MTANRENLMPAYRLRAQRARRLLRRWAVAASLWAAALAAACGVLWTVVRTDSPGLATELRETARRTAHTRAAAASCRNELGVVRKRLQTNRLIERQPDWSVLLAWTAGKLGEEVVLRRCCLAPLTDPAVRSGASVRSTSETERLTRAGTLAQEPYLLTLVGYGRSHAALSRFILDLEASELFAKVRLAKSTREPFLAATAVAFELECTIPAEGGTPR
jgi:hypothetical protein